MINADVLLKGDNWSAPALEALIDLTVLYCKSMWEQYLPLFMYYFPDDMHELCSSNS